MIDLLDRNAFGAIVIEGFEGSLLHFFPYPLFSGFLAEGSLPFVRLDEGQGFERSLDGLLKDLLVFLSLRGSFRVLLERFDLFSLLRWFSA